MVTRLLIPLCVSLAAIGCSRTQDTSSTVAEFPVTEVGTMDVVTDIYFVADIQAVRNVEIRARVNGYLENIFADEGKPVQEGQSLFKIDDEEYLARQNSAAANLKSAEASYKSAEVEKERVRLLVDKNVIARTEMDLAQAKIEIARASIDQAKAEQASARIKLEHTNVRSPFKGVIDRIPNKLGSLISEGTLLTTISDLSAVNVYFKVSEIDYLRFIRTNSKALDTLLKVDIELVLADGSMHSTKGRIETVESEFEEGTGVLAVRARFANPGNLLKHGSTGRVKIRRQISHAVLIPQKSVMEIQDRNYVFLVDQNSMVEMKSFVPMQRFEDFYIVRDGLMPGQKIVLEGVENLREGTVIRPVETKLTDVYKVPVN